MSNILTTVGRNVQYITPAGVTKAAIITQVAPDGGVSLTVFNADGSVGSVSNAKEFNAQAREVQANVYKLTWQGR
jgi:hypothetical protein